MTIGATTTFQEMRDEICTDALANLGVVAPGKDASQARTAGNLTHAARALNRLVKSMDADGFLLWRVVRRTIMVQNFDVIAGQSWTAGPDVLDIDDPMRFNPSDGSNGVAVTAMSRDDWMVVDRTGEAAIPTRFYVERSLAGLTVYMAPQITDVSATLEYSAFIRAADFTSGADTPDFLQKWTGCLVYGLTAELAAAYGQMDKLSAYRQMFLDEKTRLLSDAGEKGKTFLVPFGFGTY